MILCKNGNYATLDCLLTIPWGIKWHSFISHLSHSTRNSTNRNGNIFHETFMDEFIENCIVKTQTGL